MHDLRRNQRVFVVAAEQHHDLNQRYPTLQ